MVGVSRIHYIKIDNIRGDRGITGIVKKKILEGFSHVAL